MEQNQKKSSPPKVKAKEETITSLLKQIKDITYKKQPNIESYLSLESYFGQVSDALTIIRTYYGPDRPDSPTAMQEDLLKISAMHAGIAEMVGYLQGISARAEDTRKVVKSEYSMEIKRHRDEASNSGKIVKLTEADVDNASRVLSKDAYTAARDAEVVSRMMSAAWYAIGDFVKILNNSISRVQRELEHER
jgi:hypothetical protein